MRRLLVLVVALAAAPPAGAVPPLVEIGATPQTGMAPLESTLVASGDAASYRWEIDGVTVGEGAQLRHVFPAGHHQVAVVASAANGETARHAVTVSAFSLTLAVPRVVSFGHRARFTGRVVPGSAVRASSSNAMAAPSPPAVSAMRASTQSAVDCAHRGRTLSASASSSPGASRSLCVRASSSPYEARA